MSKILRDSRGRFLKGYPLTQFKKGHKSFIHTLTGSYKPCLECGKKFYVMSCNMDKRKFCSRSCHASNQSKRLKGKKIYLFTPKVRSKEWREKISKSLKGHSVSDKVRITSRATCLSRLPKFTDTSIELMVRRALTESGVTNFTCHKTIEGVTQPDLVFEKEKLTIFCDGDYWHSLPKVRSRDAYINKILKLRGWTVLRFKGKHIKNNLHECIRQVIHHISKTNGGGNL